MPAWKHKGPGSYSHFCPRPCLSAHRWARHPPTDRKDNGKGKNRKLSKHRRAFCRHLHGKSALKCPHSRVIATLRITVIRSGQPFDSRKQRDTAIFIAPLYLGAFYVGVLHQMGQCASAYFSASPGASDRLSKSHVCFCAAPLRRSCSTSLQPVSFDLPLLLAPEARNVWPATCGPCNGRRSRMQPCVSLMWWVRVCCDGVLCVFSVVLRVEGRRKIQLPHSLFLKPTATCGENLGVMGVCGASYARSAGPTSRGFWFELESHLHKKMYPSFFDIHGSWQCVCNHSQIT